LPSTPSWPTPPARSDAIRLIEEAIEEAERLDVAELALFGEFAEVEWAGVGMATSTPATAIAR
jgi:hypothetical protein